LTVRARTTVAALVLDSRLEGRVDLDRIVAAEPELLQLFVAQVTDQFEQLRIGAEQVLRGCSAPDSTEYFWYWPSTISPRRGTSRPSVSRSKSGSQSLPQMHLQDVPARAAEGGFQLPG
jgi:hypothetical protein